MSDSNEPQGAGVPEKGTDNRAPWAKIALLGASAISALAIPLLLVSGNRADSLIRYWGYYWMAAVFAGFAYVMLRNAAQHQWLTCDRLKRHRAGLIIALACAFILHVHEPHRFKVLFDEYALLSVSKEMHESRKAHISTRAHYIDGQVTTLSAYVDKRPDFFAFLVSVLHDTTGYRPENAFILNGVLTVASLLLLYSLGALLWGPGYGIAGMLLISSLPLLAQNATGGGMEMLNLAMLLALLVTACLYLKAPGTQGLDAMIYTAVMLACTRYESILYLLVVGVAVLLKAFFEKKISLTWFSVASPWLLFFTLLHHKVFMSDEAYWQLDGEQSNAFDTSLIGENLGDAVYYLFNPEIAATNNILLSVLGVVGLAGLLIITPRYLKKNPDKARQHLMLLSTLGVAILLFILLMSYHWGQLSDRYVARLSIPLHLFFVLGLLFTLKDIMKDRPLPRTLLAAVAVVGLMTAVPSNARHRSTEMFVPSKEYTYLGEYLRKHTTPDTLVISRSPIAAITYGRAAIPLLNLGWQLPRLDYVLKNGLYGEILLMERLMVDPRTYELIPANTRELDKLGPYLVTETLHETYFRSDTMMRLSRVTAVKPPKHGAKEMSYINPYNGTHEDEQGFTGDPEQGFESDTEFIMHRYNMLP